jgi:hypothetical protein
VPADVFKRTLARGNITPASAVFFIHTVNVSADPEGMVPARPGIPLCVSNALTMYSPAPRFFRLTDWIASVAPSGPAVFS